MNSTITLTRLVLDPERATLADRQELQLEVACDSSKISSQAPPIYFPVSTGSLPMGITSRHSYTFLNEPLIFRNYSDLHVSHQYH